MNTTIKNIGIALVSTLSIVLVVVFVMNTHNEVKADTYAQLTSQMGVGSTGTNVRNLQTFLASDSNIYPSRLVTGYYGVLTSRAVAQFQIAYNLPPVGVVGPLTLAKLNTVINAGRGIDIYAPTISGIQISKTSTSATFNWVTNKYASGKVYYSTTPFTLAEATGNFMEPTVIGGTSVVDSSALFGQQLTIQGLQPNTLYYYIIEAVDFSGNVSVTGQSTFVTP